MGWAITNSSTSQCAFCERSEIKSFVWHNGGLLGVSTILVIVPEQEIIVALISNLGNVSAEIYNLAFLIATYFA